MGKRLSIIMAMGIIGTLSACSSNPPPPVSQAQRTPSSHNQATYLDDISMIASLKEQQWEWQSVPYRLGGMSKNGVDCSGFVTLTFRKHFNIQLPRTTALQSEVGHRVSQQELRPGDLVFFKTGFNQRHVGIFLEGRSFIHASTSNGVAIASLDDRYWRERYWMARRIR